MKIIYAVYCTIDLAPLPDWVADFRAVYDKPYELHLTLKQAAYIKVDALPLIHERVAAVVALFIGRSKPIELVFDKLVLDEHDDYDQLGWIYLFCNQRNQELDDLQHEIRTVLGEFSEYLNVSSEDYERDFTPHITIGRELGVEQFARAVEALPNRPICRGKIVNVVVMGVPEMSETNINRPKYQSVYRLNSEFGS